MVAVLGAIAALRTALAAWSSYWLDELLSVEVYGRWHDSAVEAVRHLGEHSVHPPLYQWLLFHWMELFGSTEVATRSLSNLHVTLAALFLYLLLRHSTAAWVAAWSAVTFALMWAPVHYSLETRSYAQTLMLATLSSYLLVLLLFRGGRSPRALLTSAPAVGLIATNLALLMTHYYNVLFVAAQALFVAVYLLATRSGDRPIARLGYAAATYAVPVLLFAVSWGEVLLHHVGRHGGAHELDGAPLGPWRLLSDSVLGPNIVASPVVGGVIAALVVLMAFRIVSGRRAVAGDAAHRSAAPRGEGVPEADRAWVVAYLACWLVVPLALAYVGFTVLGVERYNDRYFIFSVTPLAPLTLLALEEVRAFVVDRFATGHGREAWTAVGSRVLAGSIGVALVLPGMYDAATHARHDWRGLVEQVSHVVERDEANAYIIYEASLRDEPLTDHYFSRFSDTVRPQGTLQRAEEAAGNYRLLDEDRDIVATHDRLVLLFTHPRVIHFPEALDRLSARYEVRYEQFDELGHGYIVYGIPQEERELAGNG